MYYFYLMWFLVLVFIILCNMNEKYKDYFFFIKNIFFKMYEESICIIFILIY